MTKSSITRGARREHGAEAFLVRQCCDCNRFFVLRGRVTAVADCDTEDQAHAHAHELAVAHDKSNRSRPALIMVAVLEDGVEKLPGARHVAVL